MWFVVFLVFTAGTLIACMGLSGPFMTSLYPNNHAPATPLSRRIWKSGMSMLRWRACSLHEINKHMLGIPPFNCKSSKSSCYVNVIFPDNMNIRQSSTYNDGGKQANKVEAAPARIYAVPSSDTRKQGDESQLVLNLSPDYVHDDVCVYVLSMVPRSCIHSSFVTLSNPCYMFMTHFGVKVFQSDTQFHNSQNWIISQRHEITHDLLAPKYTKHCVWQSTK